MNEVLFVCDNCRQINVIDFDQPETKKVDGLVYSEGFFCSNCENWKPVVYLTVSLKEQLDKLKRFNPGNPSHMWRMKKIFARIKRLQKRTRDKLDVKSRDLHMDVPE